MPDWANSDRGRIAGYGNWAGDWTWEGDDDWRPIDDLTGDELDELNKYLVYVESTDEFYTLLAHIDDDFPLDFWIDDFEARYGDHGE